ncbi:MAG: hypothetical protein H6703_05580 [Myxococcales bacterium]|nr:hypothetical protein [Myxococcales bacterium]
MHQPVEAVEVDEGAVGFEALDRAADPVAGRERREQPIAALVESTAVRETTTCRAARSKRMMRQRSSRPT